MNKNKDNNNNNDNNSNKKNNDNNKEKIQEIMVYNAFTLKEKQKNI